MANTQINITTNGRTTLVTSGKYCDRNIDINVSVPASGITPTGSINITENGTHDVTNYASAVVNVSTAEPTQFTNRYDPANVTIDYKVSVSSNVVSKASNSEVNILRIPYHHIAKEPFALRMRGLSTVRSNLVIVFYGADGETRVTHVFSNSSTNTITIDEYGDAVLTLPSSVTDKEWHYTELNFQYTWMSSATTALPGPILTINEPIGNGGSI